MPVMVYLTSMDVDDYRGELAMILTELGHTALAEHVGAQSDDWTWQWNGHEPANAVREIVKYQDEDWLWQAT